MSAGFYKKKTDTELQYAPNFVKNKNYTLTKNDKELSVMAEIDGWKWFDTSADACTYFAIIEKLWTDERIELLEKMDRQDKIDLLNTKDLAIPDIEAKSEIIGIRVK